MRGLAEEVRLVRRGEIEQVLDLGGLYVNETGTLTAKVPPRSFNTLVFSA